MVSVKVRVKQIHTKESNIETMYRIYKKKIQ